MDKTEAISKIKNMYIMLLYAITKEDINRVKQYLSDELVEYYEGFIQDNINKGVVQKYGELNVASVDILREDNGCLIANLTVKYIDYRIDRNTRKFKDGDTTRSKRTITLKVRYQRENEAFMYRCPKCGAPMNVNLTSVCSYCGNVLDDSESLYVIESIN